MLLVGMEFFLTQLTLTVFTHGPFTVTLQRFHHLLAFVLTTDALLRTLPIIATPLHCLTQKGVPCMEWTPECDTAFTSIRDALTHPPIMAYSDSTKPFILFTDASNSAIGSVLSQVQNGRERVIAYASHVLTGAERRWSTYDHELWAIVWSIRHFRHYFACSSFTIVTDHKPLVGLRKLPVHSDRTGRRSRWAP